VLLGSGGVFFGVRPVAVINKIKYITATLGRLVPLRFEEGRPKAVRDKVRDKVAGKFQQQYY
jgi:hypothetical protein